MERAFTETPFNPEQAAKITAPTLLLADSDTPDDWQPETVAAALPNARIAVIDGQTHAPDLLAPEVVAETILAFLRERP